MARQSRKRKFSNNQPVVFRFGERKLIGKVVFARPIGKKFSYDVLSEDGKVYTELLVDSSMNQSIDTYLTKLFYQKYNIDENLIPDVTEETPGINIKAESLIDEMERASLLEEEELPVDEDILFEEDDIDANY